MEAPQPRGQPGVWGPYPRDQVREPQLTMGQWPARAVAGEPLGRGMPPKGPWPVMRLLQLGGSGKGRERVPPQELM